MGGKGERAPLPHIPSHLFTCLSWFIISKWIALTANKELLVDFKICFISVLWFPNCSFCCGNIDFYNIKISQIYSGRIQQLWPIPTLLAAVWICGFPSKIRVHNTQIPRFLAEVEQNILQRKIGKNRNIFQVEQLKAEIGEWGKEKMIKFSKGGEGDWKGPQRNSLTEPGYKER